MLKKSIISLVCFGIVIIISGIYYIIQNSNTNINNSELSIKENELNEYLFTNKSLELIYEGGPSHWGSRSIIIKNIYENTKTKSIELNIKDNSDLKGKNSQKEWNQIWKLNSDGLYIDDILSIKLPLNIEEEWSVSNYITLTEGNKIYNAKIKVISIVDTKNEYGQDVKQITTRLTIDPLDMIYGGIYTETTVYETGIGLKSKNVTSATFGDIEFGYWLELKNDI